MATLTKQVDNLNKRVVALENSELEASDAVPFIVKLYAEFQTSPPLRCSSTTKVRAEQKMSAGAESAANDLATKINYSAVGTGVVPPPGAIGVPNEVSRKPVGTVAVVESNASEIVIIFSSFFDEQAANGELLTSAAVLYEATTLPGTGAVVASEALNIEKTSAKTLTVSTEITITEV